MNETTRENNSTQQQERTTQHGSRNETTQLVSMTETTQLCIAVDRLQPPTTPATAYNRLQPPAPPLQQNRLFLSTDLPFREGDDAHSICCGSMFSSGCGI
ncbi:hypothetical protein TNCV_4415041 [Trichonephila clavipes]|uniref:Uncharacterized protein n=1 Tax=Trichonephila clavipes TaxID=2585209 RepID=A0A8X6S9I2_TRICX|nr:hypothetical protein TNCV_4415041 [Trichonephila clavipes]